MISLVGKKQFPEMVLFEFESKLSISNYQVYLGIGDDKTELPIDRMDNILIIKVPSLQNGNPYNTWLSVFSGDQLLYLTRIHITKIAPQRRKMATQYYGRNDLITIDDTKKNNTESLSSATKNDEIITTVTTNHVFNADEFFYDIASIADAAKKYIFHEVG